MTALERLVAGSLTVITPCVWWIACTLQQIYNLLKDHVK